MKNNLSDMINHLEEMIKNLESLKNKLRAKLIIDLRNQLKTKK
jgi:hypothetical protein